MDILEQLGINATAVIQLLFFAIALIFLSKVVFGPYAHALEERERRTKGGEELAHEFQSKSIELQSTYEMKAREVNAEIKAIFDSSKAAANKEYEQKVASTRAEAEKLIQKNREQISTSVTQAMGEIKSQTNAIAMAITSKLLGK